jgi:hypothetical protein
MENHSTAIHGSLRKDDWIRFQVTANKIVLEGFIQEVSPDDTTITVGKAPLSPEKTSYSLAAITILRHQAR